MTPLAFVDCETTGLDPDQHEVWEVALILRDSEGVEVERVWQLPVDLGRADPMALKIGRYHERRIEKYSDEDGEVAVVDHPATFAADFAELTIGAHLVGAVISFDEERLRRLLRRHGQCPMWHYHLIDVEALAAGWLAGRYLDERWSAPDDTGACHRPPWTSTALSDAVGIDPDLFDRHTALGDARWARAIYDAVMAHG